MGWDRTHGPQDERVEVGALPMSHGGAVPGAMSKIPITTATKLALNLKIHSVCKMRVAQKQKEKFTSSTLDATESDVPHSKLNI